MRCTPDEMHAYEIHAYEMHAHEMHTHKMHAHRSDFSNNGFVCEVPRRRIRLALNSHSNSLPRSIPQETLARVQFDSGPFGLAFKASLNFTQPNSCDSTCIGTAALPTSGMWHNRRT